MAMAVGSPGGDGDDEEVVSSINTTPLVDVMLVLLIIFLITIPVVTQTIKLELPKEVNIPNQTKPENIVLSVDREGDMFWGQTKLKDTADLFERLKPVAVTVPQPEVHIRGDLETRYEPIGKIVYTLQRAGIVKVGFITEPPPHGG
ncbi:MAG: biopolymer transporter ExbD [Aliidongia sp.]